jgi:OOP family OmpA-OmpF porin
MTAIDKQESATNYKLYAGYKFNRNFAIEGGYFKLGDFGFTSSTVPAGSLRGNISLQGLNVDAVAIWPLTSRFSANARVGVNYAEAVDSFSGTGAVHVLNPNPTAKEANLKVGLGLQYALTDSLSVRADLERYRINDAVGNHGDVDHLSVGLVVLFGADKPAPAYVAPIAYVAPQPPPPAPAQPPPVYVAPAPPVVAAPPKIVAPAPRKVVFSADSLFDFDKAVVKPDGKSALNKFVKELSGVNYDVIKVTGHTDRIGAHAYNLALSQRRAQAVSLYLVDSGGIASGKISATGVNGADPVTTPEQCNGVKPLKAKVACLAPDRRVEVEVTGTQ